MSSGVDFQAAESQRLFTLRHRTGPPPQNGTQARQQFPGLERLRQIIIGAELQTYYAVDWCRPVR